MTVIISKIPTDCPHIKAVPAIATYDSNGNILPLYVRIGEEKLKVYNAYISESTRKILTFKGEVIVQDRVKPIKLNYYVDDLVWCVVE